MYRLSIYLSIMFIGGFILPNVECASNSTKSKQLGSFLLDKPECTKKRVNEIDSLMVKLLAVGPDGRSFPEDYDGVKPFCRETDRLTNEVDKFITECYPQEQQRIFKIFIFSAKKNMKTFCGKKRTKKLTKLLQLAPCLNPLVKHIDCVEIYTNKTKNLVRYDIGGDKIKYTCCDYVDALKCAENRLTVDCLSGDGRDTIMDLVRGLAGDLVNFACGDYNESTDRCETLKPLPKSKYDKSIKLPKTKSLPMAHIALLESIGGFSDDLFGGH